MNTRSVQRTLLASAGLKALPVGVLTDIQGMRVGTEYQAPVPEYKQGVCSYGPGSLLLWKPSELLTDTELDNYLRLSKDQFGYSIDQALGMLYYHNYDVTKAFSDLANFCPLQEDWSMEDKVIFEQAFRYHDKNFHRIKSMLPDKPISSLVKYYYLWKRSYSQYSLMDKQARKNNKRMSSGLPPSNDDTDSTHSSSNRSINDVPPPPHMLPPVQLVGKGKQLPKGIYMSTAELSCLVNDGIIVINSLDKELLNLKTEIQTGKQELSQLREKIYESEDVIESLRPLNYSERNNVPTKWSEDEITVALEVINKCGKDIESLSRALPSKSVSQCRNFFTNYKRKLNLPRLIAEYEIKHGQKLSRYSRQAAEHIQTSQEMGISSSDNMLNIHQSLLGVHDNTVDHTELVNKRPRLSDYNINTVRHYI